MGILDKLVKKKDETGKKPVAKKASRKVKRVREKKARKPKAEKVKSEVREDSLAYRVLRKPMITEKASYLGANNQYVFEVGKNATKTEIRQAINDVYGVLPVKVMTISLKGKSRRYGRSVGATSDRKKAIVTLPQGKTIEIYEGV